jgi:hypothetical protein
MYLPRPHQLVSVFHLTEEVRLVLILLANIPEVMGPNLTRGTEYSHVLSSSLLLSNYNFACGSVWV